MTVPSIPRSPTAAHPTTTTATSSSATATRTGTLNKSRTSFEVAVKGESHAAWDLYPLTTDLELIAKQAEDEDRPGLAAIIRHGAWVLDAATGMYGFAGRDDEWDGNTPVNASPRRSGGRTSRWSPRSSTPTGRGRAGTRGAARRS